MATTKYFVALAAFVIALLVLVPVGVSSMYGGRPPPHIAKTLDRQTEALAKAVPMFFAPFQGMIELAKTTTNR